MLTFTDRVELLDVHVRVIISDPNLKCFASVFRYPPLFRGSNAILLIPHLFASRAVRSTNRMDPMRLRLLTDSFYPN